MHGKIQGKFFDGDVETGEVHVKRRQPIAYCKAAEGAVSSTTVPVGENGLFLGLWCWCPRCRRDVSGSDLAVAVEWLGGQKQTVVCPP